VNSKLHFLIENGLQNGVVKRGKQTINILCSSEQILELFQKGRMGWGLMGAWGKKRFAAKCIFRENGKLCVVGVGDGDQEKSEEYNPLQAAAHPSNS